jgi:predicted nucleic-acid-binding Zn-ribbon protein
MVDKCPKCGSEMEEGVRPDYGFGDILTEWWMKKSDVEIVKDGKQIKKKGLIGISNVDKANLVTTWGCTKCGYLESYVERK